MSARLVTVLAILAILVGVALATSSVGTAGWVLPGRRAAPVEDSSTPPLRLVRPGAPVGATISPAAAWEIGRAAVESGRPESATLQESGDRLVYVLVFEGEDGRASEAIIDARSGALILVR